jgi:hypothetical protein
VVNIDNGKEIAFVPYTTNTLEYLDSIDNKFSKGASRILIGHFDIKNNYYLTLSANNACLQIPTAEELINKYGLRTLAKGEPGYIGVYEGGPAKRDSSYHQGPTWPWLFGLYYNAMKNVISAENDVEQKKKKN